MPLRNGREMEGDLVAHGTPHQRSGCGGGLRDRKRKRDENTELRVRNSREGVARSKGTVSDGKAVVDNHSDRCPDMCRDGQESGQQKKARVSEVMAAKTSEKSSEPICGADNKDSSGGIKAYSHRGSYNLWREREKRRNRVNALRASAACSNNAGEKMGAGEGGHESAGPHSPCES